MGGFGGHGPKAASPMGEVLVAVAFYFTSTIALTFCNKWLMSRSSLKFHFPLSTTAIYQLAVFLILVLFESLIVKRTGQILKSWSFVWKIAPIGVLCGLDWGLSNVSLRTVDLSLYEMIKSTSPVFVLFFAVAFGLQSLSKTLLVSIALITIGTYLSVCGLDGTAAMFTTNFPMFGALCVLVSAILSGFRSVMIQFVMQKMVESTENKSAINAITTLYFIAPSTAFSLAIPAAYLEGAGLVQYFQQIDSGSLQFLLFVLGGSSLIAFAVSMSGLVLTKKTSALTYSVVQISERVLIVGLSMLTFGDHVGLWNAIGFGTTLGGIALYNYYKLFMVSKEAEVVEGKPLTQADKTRSSLKRRESLSSSFALMVTDHHDDEHEEVSDDAPITSSQPPRSEGSAIITGKEKKKAQYGTSGST